MITLIEMQMFGPQLHLAVFHKDKFQLKLDLKYGRPFILLLLSPFLALCGIYWDVQILVTNVDN